MNTKLAAYLSYGMAKRAVFSTHVLPTLRNLAKPLTRAMHNTSVYTGKNIPKLNKLEGRHALDHFQKMYGSGPLSSGGMLRANKALNRAATGADVRLYQTAATVQPWLENPLIEHLLPG